MNTTHSKRRQHHAPTAILTMLISSLSESANKIGKISTWTCQTLNNTFGLRLGLGLRLEFGLGLYFFTKKISNFVFFEFNTSIYNVISYLCLPLLLLIN